jgi:hypothetical protein
MASEYAKAAVADAVDAIDKLPAIIYLTVRALGLASPRRDRLAAGAR